MSDNETIEMNVAGVKFFMRLVEACAKMREHIRYLNNTRDQTWNDWDGSYEIDALLLEAGYEQEEERDE